MDQVEPTAKARRFQPPRRKERASKARNEREVLPRDAPCTANEHSSVPMPPPLPRTTTPRGTVNALSAPTAPSAEMAWLLRVSERFDEEAAQADEWGEIYLTTFGRKMEVLHPSGFHRLSSFCEVQAFLAEHSLEQYAVNSVMHQLDSCDKLPMGEVEAALLESGPGAPGSSMEAKIGIFVSRWLDMGVSKNRGVFPPKWMVYNGKPYKNSWFGG